MKLIYSFLYNIWINLANVCILIPARFLLLRVIDNSYLPFFYHEIKSTGETYSYLEVNKSNTV